MANSAFIALTLGFMAVFILLALSGVATLCMAIAADLDASLSVIFNNLRLLPSLDVTVRTH